MPHVLRCWGCLIGVLGMVLLLAAPGVRGAAALGQPGPTTTDVNQVTKNMRLLGQLGGGARVVKVVGDLAYVGEGPRLTVLNIANPAAPVVVGKTTPLPDEVYDLVVVGQTAYLAAGSGGLQIIDVANPANPRLLGSYSLGFAQAIAVAGTVAYITNGSLQIIDITNPAAPFLLSSFTAPEEGDDLFVVGNIAYVADEEGDLYLVDVTDPTKPTQINTYPATGIYEVVVVDAIAYLTDGFNLRLVNVANPNNLVELGVLPLSTSVRGIFVANNRAYLTGDGGLRIINVADPAKLTQVGAFSIPGWPESSFVAGELVYLSHPDDGLHILDAANPAAPTQIGNYTSPAFVSDVTLVGPRAYMADSTGLTILNSADPARPVIIGHYATPERAQGVAVADNIAYLAVGFSGLYLIDISNPTQPTLLGIYNTPSSVSDVAVEGDTAYVAAGSNGVRVINVAAPDNPTETRFYDTAGSANGLFVALGTVFIADGSNGLRAMQGSTGAEIGAYDTPGTAENVFVANGVAYVADGASGLRLVRVSSFPNFTEIGAFPTPGYAKGVFAVGTLAYVAAGTFHVVNVATPATPSELGSYSELGGSENVFVTTNAIYAAAGSGGLATLRYPACYQLTATHTGAGADPIATPANSPGCLASEYIPGELITLTANPATSSRVINWVGTNNDNTTSRNNVLTMPAADHEVVVNYTPTCFTLTLTHSGEGADPTASPTNSLNCAPGQYIAGATITLRAAPSAGYTVGGWSGTTNNSSSAGENTVTMPAANHTAGVNYELACYQLTLSHSGEGSDPTATPGQSANCAAGRYHFNEPISLSAATPASGWQIASWSGTANNASTAATNSLTMPANDHTAGVQYSLQATAGEGDVYELDNLCTRSRLIAIDGSETQEHTFHAANDLDWVRLNATANVTYRIEVRVPATSTADVNLEVYGLCEGAVLEQWNASFSPEVRLDFKASASGPIYLRLANQPANVAGSQVHYALTVRTLEQASTNRALILVAGRLKGTDSLQRNIHNVTNAVYKLFQRNGYDDEHIQYLATEATLPGRDGPPTRDTLRSAITEWAKSKLSADGVLTLYLMDHGSPELFYLDEQQGQRLTPTDLNDWLNTVEQAVPNLKVNVIIEACQSGSFIAPPQTISKAGRVILASTSPENDAKASKDGAYFSDHFLTWLHQGYNLFASFSEAQAVAQSVFALQKAQLDADGNGVPNEFSDGALAAKRSFAYAGSLPADDWPPHIFSVQGPISITNASGVIQAEVSDNLQVRQVWAVVYPPDYAPPPTGQELQPEVLPTILFTLADEGKQLYAGKFTGFTQRGVYRLVVHAEDADGLVARPLVLEVNPTGGQVFLPVVGR